MKVLIFTDNHFCETSSILRQFGTKYTLRLENQILSLNWVEKTAEKNSCEAVICAGDFFDKSTLTDQELTALRDIKWSKLPHYFLVGNHESSTHELNINSTKAVASKTRQVISEPTTIDYGEAEICFLPYILESDRKPIAEYFTKPLKKRVIISHNDLLNVQMGPAISKLGFDPKELEANADLIINGHLHNGQKITNKVINLGNLTGQNFSEDATRYSHNVMILDLDTLKYELIENPYAFNFYKIDINKEKDLDKLDYLKPNAVLSISCKDTLLDKCKTLLNNKSEVITSRIIVTRDLASTGTDVDMSDFSVDYISKFITCAKSVCENSKILDEELTEICR